MILQALANYYDYVCEHHSDRIAHPGWCTRQVSSILDLSSNGTLVAVIPADEKHGCTRIIPEQVKRSSGVQANLLCDTSSYLLGIDNKGKPERTRQCFLAAKKRHLTFLEKVDSSSAKAVFAFFDKWDPEHAFEYPVVANAGETLTAGGNLEFSVNGKRVLDDPAICDEWNFEYANTSDDAIIMTCLVTGEKAPIARLHPAIKGIVGSQPMGASLVSFNEQAFESYGHDNEQGLNAPVSERATFAYSTALNYLLADKDHHMRLGDTTVVYWADRCDDECSEIYTSLLNPQASAKESSDVADTELIINDIMTKIRNGQHFEDVDLEANFFVLGLAPNAARASVRFFYQGTFGSMLKNLSKHYERISIVHAPYEREYLTPFMLLKETENPSSTQKEATSILGGALMRSILGDLPYPEGLYEQTLLRVRATQDDKDRHIYKVTRGKAAIVKAYLLKNCHRKREEITVSLNEKRKDAPYILGRLFSVLEDIQETANPGVNSSIKDKYYDSACATPNAIFPILFKLSSKHLSKLKRDNPGLAIYYDKLLGGLLDSLETLPKHLDLEAQGDFLLGYYHQRQSKYEKHEQDAIESKEN